MNEMTKRNLVSDISCVRTYMMGIAMISIMLFHETFGVLGPLSCLFKFYGDWGVDVFLFLSGFGIYYSLKKEDGSSLSKFFTRRVLRIMPASIVAGFCLFIVGKANIYGCVGLNLWYIRTILILYLFSPLVYKCLSNYNPWKVLLIATCVSLICVLIGVPMVKNEDFIFQTTLVWTFARMPSFVMGMFIAHIKLDIKQLVNPVCIVFAVLIFFVLILLRYVQVIREEFSTYLHLLPYVVLAYMMPFFLVIFLMFWKKIPRLFLCIIAFFGTYSLELYLVHEAIFGEIVKLTYSLPAKFMIAYGTSMVAAFVLHYFVSLLFVVVPKKRAR